MHWPNANSGLFYVRDLCNLEFCYPWGRLEVLEPTLHGYPRQTVYHVCSYIYVSMLKFTFLKKIDILSSAATWMEMEDIMLNGISQAQQDKHHLFSLTHGS